MSYLCSILIKEEDAHVVINSNRFSSLDATCRKDFGSVNIKPSAPCTVTITNSNEIFKQTTFVYYLEKSAEKREQGESCPGRTKTQSFLLHLFGLCLSGSHVANNNNKEPCGIFRTDRFIVA